MDDHEGQVPCHAARVPRPGDAARISCAVTKPVREISALTLLRVIQITDRLAVEDGALAARIDAAGRGHGGAFAVLLRDKDLPRAERRALGLSLRALTRRAGARLVVAADLEIAREIGADGVHFGAAGRAQLAAAATDWPGAWLSIACHSVDEVAKAAEAGATIALLSPIFSTPGKGEPIGLEALSRARAAIDARGSSIVLVALGGVTVESARACLRAGAGAVASIRADLTPVLAETPTA